MKKNLFGSLGDMLRGNWVIVALSLCVVAAGALSFYTVNDINNKLESQSIPNPNSLPSQQPYEEQAQNVQTEGEKVPIKDKPIEAKPTKAPEATEKETQTEPEAEVSADREFFVLPVEGKIFAAFTGSELVYNKTMDDWRTHNGVDIKASAGSAVKASCDGRVKKIYNDGMLGWTVEAECDGFTVRYCGLDKSVAVREGQEIFRNQPIGTVGEIPLEIAEDSHIHLEIIKDGNYVNPDKYLK